MSATAESPPQPSSRQRDRAAISIARPPLLLIHGAGGGGWEWDLWRVRMAAAGWSVQAPDLQPSSAGLAATTFDDYAAQCTDALARCGPAAVVIGASLGGLLALQLAADSRVRAVVLVNPLPPAPEAMQLPAAGDRGALVRWRSGGRFESTRRALADTDEAAQLHAFRRWRDESGAVLATACAGVALPPPRCPVLVIVSEQDDEVSAALGAQLARRLSAELIRVPGSHLAPVLGSSAGVAVKAAIGWLDRIL